MKVITLDKEIFEKAFVLCNKTLEMEDVVNILEGSDDVEKQIALLQISDIENKMQAELVVRHLTGQDGPVREAAALKIRELLLEKKSLLMDFENFYTVYVDAVCDVNPNISRFVIEFLPLLKNRKLLYETLLSKIGQIYQRIDNPDKAQKNFLTVRLFNLYWLLEAIGTLMKYDREGLDFEHLLVFLDRALNFNDYTIDEKVARIITLVEFSGAEGLKKKLLSTGNFYVKRYFKEF